MSQHRLPLLFRRYVDGTLSENEKREFFNMIEESDYDKRLKSLMDELWTSIPDKPASFLDSRASFEALRSKVNDQPARPAKRHQLTTWLVAAVVAMVGLGSFFFYPKSEELSGSGQLTETVADPKFLVLPDGSSVLLNEGSKIEYAVDFGLTSREVFLDGEGYFDIKHDPSKPFLVRTNTVTTTVLGTAFNVRAFPSDKKVVVTVTRGKVEVSRDKRVIGVINPDEQITVATETENQVQEQVNSKAVLTWIERDIHFNDVSMADAAVELENRFGVKINLMNDDLKRCRFTATFTRGEDIEQIMLVIAEFNHANFVYDRQNRTMIIDGDGCKP